MKTVILSINSRYIHTLLAPRYLKANTFGHDVKIIETNISENIQDLFEQLHKLQPNVLAISCYIFNIVYIRKLLDEIRLILPEVIIILGGYEAAFDTNRYFDIADYIIKGEGDLVFNKLLDDIKLGKKQLPKIIESGTVPDLSVIKSPYTDDYAKLGKNRILYFETTRGCPYKCSYCMSSNSKGVRTFPINYIKENLFFLISHNPKQIKFVDRTFNYDVDRANYIFTFLIDNFYNKSTNFHFEMAPELFNEQTFSILSTAPKGLFQFEIGIQSYNKNTLKTVGRSANIDKIDSNLKRLVALNNINIHVDLIAGLPYEDLQSFASGFDKLILHFPNCLQLGFLKVLKGSKLADESTDIKTFNSPPYEVVTTPHLSYSNILQLKGVEEMLDLYYNSRRFVLSINYILSNVASAFSMFTDISKFFKERGFTKRNTGAKTQCDLLFSYLLQLKDKNLDTNHIQNLISTDYENSGNMRKWRFLNIV